MLTSADIADELDSTARRKSKKKTRPLSSALSVKSSRPVQLSAADVAKGAMTLQEPQLLDKMENVAYRLQTQAHERKKRMNSRYLPACPTILVSCLLSTCFDTSARKFRCKTCAVEPQLQSTRVRWLGCALRLPNGRMAKKLLPGEVQGAASTWPH